MLTFWENNPVPPDPQTERLGYKSWAKPYFNGRERRQLIAAGAEVVSKYKFEQFKEAGIQKQASKDLDELDKMLTLASEGKDKTSPYFLRRQRGNASMAAAVAVLLCVTGAGAVSNNTELNITPGRAAEREMNRTGRELDGLDIEGIVLLEEPQANTLYLSDNPAAAYEIGACARSITIPLQASGDTAARPI